MAKGVFLVNPLMITAELINHGMKAKNKFQFKKRKKVVSVTKNRIIDKPKQNKDIAIKSSVIFSLFNSLSFGIDFIAFS